MDITELEHRAQICVDEYDGIIPYVEAFYIHSVIYPAERCLNSFARYDSLKDADTGNNADELVSLIQEAVGHSAALSRFFWPSPQGKKKQPNLIKLKKKRGEKLQEAFQLNETSVLYKKELRNAWEHFDERLDSYFLENDAGFFFPTCILGSHALADDPTGHIFKLLDVEAECLALLGVKYFFKPIREAVQTVLNRTLELDENGSRLAVK